jgi:hypothetical protein
LFAAVSCWTINAIVILPTELFPAIMTHLISYTTIYMLFDQSNVNFTTHYHTSLPITILILVSLIIFKILLKELRTKTCKIEYNHLPSKLVLRIYHDMPGVWFQARYFNPSTTKDKNFTAHNVLLYDLPGKRYAHCFIW